MAFSPGICYLNTSYLRGTLPCRLSTEMARSAGLSAQSTSREAKLGSMYKPLTDDGCQSMGRAPSVSPTTDSDTQRARVSKSKLLLLGSGQRVHWEKQ